MSMAICLLVCINCQQILTIKSFVVRLIKQKLVGTNTPRAWQAADGAKQLQGRSPCVAE